VAQKFSRTTLPFSSARSVLPPPNISTVKSGALSPAFTSVVDSTSPAFLLLLPPHEGSSRMTATIATISASMIHNCLLLFFVAMFFRCFGLSGTLSHGVRSAGRKLL